MSFVGIANHHAGFNHNIFVFRYSSADLPNWVWDNYQETVTMSTYLLAFVVAEDYDFREAAAGTFNKPVRVSI